MGFDVSVVVVPASLSDADIVGATRAVPALAGPGVAVLIGSADAAPSEFRRAFPSFTALSFWGAGSGLSKLAAQLSSRSGMRVLVLTQADHSLVGGYLVFEAGQLVISRWMDAEEYLNAPLEGVRVAYGASFALSQAEGQSLAELLAHPERGILLDRNGHFVALGEAEAIKVLEDDLPGYSSEPILAAEE